ncbi:ATP synthase F(0) sector subunit c [Gammaproteobacteria bacterium]
MYWLIAVMSFSLLGTMGLGAWLEFNPTTTGASTPRWLRRTVNANLIGFVATGIGMMFIGMREVMAVTEPVAGTAHEISMGMGMAMIGIALPTAMATLAASYAVAAIGSAALAVLAERPESFGRSLIFLGLAEGIAIYGLVVSILMLGKLG